MVLYCYEAFKKISFDEAVPVLRFLDENFERNRPGYESVFKSLQKMKPKLSKDTYIIIEKDSSDDDHEWLYCQRFGHRYCVDFTPWAEVIGYRIPKRMEADIATDSGIGRIVGFILFEITFHGFTEKKMQREMERLLKIASNKKGKVFEYDPKKKDFFEVRTGYKVVMKDGDRFLSARFILAPAVYVPGKYTFPPKNYSIHLKGLPSKPGPLAVFDTIENARAYVEYESKVTKKYSKQSVPNMLFNVNRALQIWKCSYEPSRRKIRLGAWKRFSFPKGTKFAERVRLTKKVK